MSQTQPPFAITNVSVFDGEFFAPQQAIVVEGDTITRIVPMLACQAGTETLPTLQIDGKGNLATAGFIDLQLNGCGGVLFNTTVNADTLHTMNATNVQSGTTQFLPTLITSEREVLRQALAVMHSLPDAANMGVLGLHLEGPFISYEKKGAHNPDWIQTLDEATARLLAEHHPDIAVITLAPERTSQAVIDILTQAGITVSLGHTNATYQELTDKQGLTMATHLYNAMTPFASREPGAVGYIFDHKPYAGIIVDGIHAAYPAVRIAHQQLGEKLFLVTDAVTPAGTDMTEYDMAGTPAFVTNGKCHYADGTIAGAAITMIEGVRNLIDHVGISKEEALRMASWYPANAMGIAQEYGRLAAGYKANITLLDADMSVHAVFQMGQQRL